jgi:hypothetical protein
MGDLGGRGGGIPILKCSWDWERLRSRREDECFFRTDGVRVREVVCCSCSKEAVTVSSSCSGSESDEKSAKCRSSGLAPLGPPCAAA